MTRFACAKTCEVTAKAEPSLFVALSPAQFKSTGRQGQLEAGKTKWIEAGTKDTVENAGQGHAEFLRFDLKSKPTKGDGKEAPHAHPHQ